MHFVTPVGVIFSGSGSPDMASLLVRSRTGKFFKDGFMGDTRTLDRQRIESNSRQQNSERPGRNQACQFRDRGAFPLTRSSLLSTSKAHNDHPVKAFAKVRFNDYKVGQTNNGHGGGILVKSQFGDNSSEIVSIAFKNIPGTVGTNFAQP